MWFNSDRRSIDTVPEMVIDGYSLELVESMKLLGVMITRNLTLNDNTQYITKRGFSKLWMLRRLKQFGANSSQLLEREFKFISYVTKYNKQVFYREPPR